MVRAFFRDVDWKEMHQAGLLGPSMGKPCSIPIHKFCCDTGLAIEQLEVISPWIGVVVAYPPFPRTCVCRLGQVVAGAK